MEQSVAIFASINFLIMGASHCIRPKTWTEFFGWLTALGRPGAYLNGFLGLLMGSIIVSFHNLWHGVPTLLTVVEWAYLLKSIGIFVWPDWGVRSMAQVETTAPYKFLIAGIGLLVLGVTMLTCVFSGSYVTTQ